MSITIQATQGLFSDEAEKDIIRGVTESILGANQAQGNELARYHPIVTLLKLSASDMSAGTGHAPFVVLSVHSRFASLDTDDKREKFVTAITDLMEKAAEGRLERDRIYVSLLDGDMWGIGGKLYKNTDL